MLPRRCAHHRVLRKRGHNYEGSEKSWNGKLPSRPFSQDPPGIHPLRCCLMSHSYLTRFSTETLPAIP